MGADVRYLRLLDAIGLGPSGRLEQVENRALHGSEAKEGCTGTVRVRRRSALVFGEIG